MPNDRLEQAIKEAYAQAKEDIVVFETLEISNPNVDPIYMVQQL